MISKKLLLVLVFVLAPTSSWGQDNAAIDNTLRTFYQWYLFCPLGSRGNPEYKKKILEYVDKSYIVFIDQVAEVCKGEECLYDVDYFTKTQDWDEKEWIENMKISKPIYSGNKAVVAVSMGSGQHMSTKIFVVLKKANDKWKILNVVDGNDS